jgi:hypothetical protein
MCMIYIGVQLILASDVVIADKFSADADHKVYTSKYIYLLYIYCCDVDYDNQYCYCGLESALDSYPRCLGGT